MVSAVLAHTVMPTLAEITAAQKADPKLQVVRKYMQSDSKTRDIEKVPPEYRNHVEFMQEHDGTLYYRDIQNDEWMTNAIVLPEAMIETALEAFHDSGYGCHLGAHKTQVALRERVWFPHYCKRVKEHVQGCAACKRSKAVRRQHVGKLRQTLYLQPYERVAVDLVGPYLPSTNGNKWILHVVCMATNYSVTVPIPNKEAKTVAKAFHDHVIIGGPCVCPVEILSDRGSEFLNSVFGAMTEQYNLKHLKTTAMHPTGNSQNERVHRTLGAILKTMLHKYGKDFEEALKYATYAINTHAIDGTSISPYEMIFGRKPADPNSVAATDNPAGRVAS